MKTNVDSLSVENYIIPEVFGPFTSPLSSSKGAFILKGFTQQIDLRIIILISMVNVHNHSKKYKGKLYLTNR